MAVGGNRICCRLLNLNTMSASTHLRLSRCHHCNQRKKSERCRRHKNLLCHSGTEGREQPGSCPGHQPKQALRRHWNNRKYGASKLRELSAISARALRNISQPFHRPKKCKECRFEGAPNYYPARGAHVSLTGPDAMI